MLVYISRQNICYSICWKKLLASPNTVIHVICYYFNFYVTTGLNLIIENKYFIKIDIFQKVLNFVKRLKNDKESN